MKRKSLFTAAFRSVKESFELICGRDAEHKPRAGTSLDRGVSSAPNMGLTSERTHPHDMPLKCVFCFFVRKEPVQALTVMNGQAVCYNHSYYVQGGEFMRALTIIQRDEQRNS
jgi:hypothetical protein